MPLVDWPGIGSTLYLTAAPDLLAGTEITSGYWRGEVSSWTLARSGSGGQQELTPEATHVLLELAWEMVRLQQFPDRPRRLDSLFLWADEVAARAWHYRKHTLRAATAGLYEVEVLICERVFAADMDLISYIDPGDTLGHVVGAGAALLAGRARRCAA